MPVMRGLILTSTGAPLVFRPNICRKEAWLSDSSTSENSSSVDRSISTKDKQEFIPFSVSPPCSFSLQQFVRCWLYQQYIRGFSCFKLCPMCNSSRSEIRLSGL